MSSDIIPKERIEVFWGKHHGGWIRGRVVEKATEDDELIEMDR